MSARRRCRALLGLAGALAAALVPAGAATAAVGSDTFQGAPPLLFSVPGSVGDTFPYTAAGGEPGASPPGPPCPAMFHTAWWVFTGTGQQIALTTDGSGFDTTLAVYDHGGPGGSPLAGNRKACATDSPLGVQAALSFPSVRGREYLVEVGGDLTSRHGSVALSASSPVRPANDDRASPRALQTSVPVAVSNVGASHELDEPRTCRGAGYAATMWFSWTAPAVGDAVFSSSAAFGDTVVAVYRDGGLVGCNAGSTATATARVSPGEYLVQVGTKGSDVVGLGEGAITTSVNFTLDPDVDNDGELASSDCNDANPAIRHGVVDAPDDGIDQDCDGADAVNLDRDRDGENRPGDCNDGNPAINHGARDIPGNAVDEDCADGPAPFPQLESTVRTGWRLRPFHLTKLEVLRAVAGSRVVLRCKGDGCPFKRKVVKVRKSSASLSVLGRKLKRARLKQGAVLEVRITKRGFVGFMRRHTVRRGGKDPRIEGLCLPVGAGKPKRC